MGTETFVSDRPFVNEPPINKSGAPKRAVDLPLLVVVIALVVFGLIMMFSASWDYSLTEYGSPMYMFVHQLAWLAIGILAAFVLSLFDYHHLRKLVVPLMGLTIVLLVAVLLVNEILLGARRYLFEGSFQPSELAKVITILYLAVWLYAKRQFIHDITFGVLPLSVILGVIGGLIYQQPDLSTAAMVLMLGGLLFFLAGGDLKQIAILLVIAIVVGWIVVRINPTGHDRVAAFIAGLKDPTQASYHVQRSFEAIVNGGWFGVGIGQRAIKINRITRATHRQHLRSDRGGAGFIGCNLFDYSLWNIDLARICDRPPRAGYARHTDCFRPGRFDWHPGGNQHVGDGWADSVFGRCAPLCQRRRIEFDRLACIHWYLNEHLTPTRRGDCANNVR